MRSFDKSLLIDDIPDQSEPFVEYFVFKGVDFPGLFENFDFESLRSEKTLVEETLSFVLVRHGIIGLCASTDFLISIIRNLWSV